MWVSVQSFYRGGSASKKNGLPAPSNHSEAARCASTGNCQASLHPLVRRPQMGNFPSCEIRFTRHGRLVVALRWVGSEGSVNEFVCFDVVRELLII